MLAFFDVDGTLTHRSPESGPTDVPRPQVQEAVRAFARRGNIAVLCTGRGALGIGSVLRSLPFRGLVTLDGTYVTLDGEVVEDRSFSAELVGRMAAEMARVGMSCLIGGCGGHVVFAPGNRNPYEREASVLELVHTPQELVARHAELHFSKVDYFGEDYDHFRESPWLVEHFTHYNVGDGFHELVAPGASKGTGARAVLDALSRKGEVPSRVFAFGDSENDLPVLELADVAVVMGQASEHVRARAAYVTDSAANDGVVSALEHFGLV